MILDLGLKKSHPLKAVVRDSEAQREVVGHCSDKHKHVHPNFHS